MRNRIKIAAFSVLAFVLTVGYHLYASGVVEAGGRWSGVD